MKARKSTVAAWSSIAGLAIFSSVNVHGAVIMDQIGTVPSFVTGQNAYVSQVFESAHATDDVAVVDDFTVTGPTVLTKIYAAVDGFGSGFVGFSDVTSWDVEIYSSLTAASSSLIGDVYGRTFAPAGVTVTTPFGGSSTSALVSATTAISLPTPGAYYLAVIANNSFTSNGEVGVYATSGVTASTPGNLNAYQSNPQGGFGFSSNLNPLSLDAAYAITGVAVVPEPTNALLLGATVGAITLTRRATRSHPLDVR